MTGVTVILGISLGLLVTALVLSLYRLTKGPTALDRAVAVDVFAASVVAIIVIVVLTQDRYDLAALLIVFVLTAFFSTVTVARFFNPSHGRRRKTWVSPTRRVTIPTAAPIQEEAVAEAPEKSQETERSKEPAGKESAPDVTP